MRDATERHILSRMRRQSVRHPPFVRFSDSTAPQRGIHLRDCPRDGDRSMNIYFTRKRKYSNINEKSSGVSHNVDVKP
jgi:hypothetical protein